MNIPVKWLPIRIEDKIIQFLLALMLRDNLGRSLKFQDGWEDGGERFHPQWTSKGDTIIIATGPKTRQAKPSQHTHRAQNFTRRIVGDSRYHAAPDRRVYADISD